MGLGDDFVARPDLQRLQRHLERSRARRHGLGVAGAQILGERGLEVLHLVHVVAEAREALPEQDRAVVEHLIDGAPLFFSDDLPTGHASSYCLPAVCASRIRTCSARSAS